MMRDDVLKRKMRAAMPLPTPLFTGRVRQTLDRLPERKKASALRFVPVAAMTVVAVAVIGLAVASRMDPGGVNNWFQALSGGEGTAATTEPPAETSLAATGYQAGEKPFAGLAPEQIESIRMVVYHDSQPPEDPDPYKDTVLPGEVQTLVGILRGIEIAKPIELTQLPVGSTAYRFTLRKKDGSVLEIGLYGDHNLIMEGQTYETSVLPDMDSAFEAMTGEVMLMGGEETTAPQGTDPQEQQTLVSEPTDTTMPTPAPQTTRVMLQSTSGSPEMTAAPSPNTTTGEGQSIFGNKAKLLDIQVLGGATTYVFEVEASEKLTEYYNSLKPDQNGMVTIKPYWEESDKPPMLIFLICSGVSKQQNVDRDRMSFTISTFVDNTKYGIYVRDITASMNTCDNGKSYMLFIRNENKNYQPTSDFTIFTCSTYFETGTGLEYYGVACN